MNDLLLIGITATSTALIYTGVLVVIKINKKIKELAFILKNFPSPEQMAKEILKVKLPIQELPPELQKKALENLKKKENKNKIDGKHVQKASYVG